MVFIAKMQDEIPATAKILDVLAKLAQMPQFTAVPEKEVVACNVDSKDVMACVGHLYAKVCKYTHGNDEEWFENAVILRAREYEDYEVTSLVIFLKTQSELQLPLNWREDTSCKVAG